MLDPQHIGHQWPAYTVDVERGQVIAFARALGATDPVYFDSAAAKAAGYRDIPALPTFPIALSQTQVQIIYSMLAMLNIDPARILHGTQKFVFHGCLCAGDRLTGVKRISNLYDRKGGALSFIETITLYKGPSGQALCEDHCTLVCRNS